MLMKATAVLAAAGAAILALAGCSGGADSTATGQPNQSPIGEAQGSGCTPGAGPLPDGQWFGFVTEWGESSVSFDLACMWGWDFTDGSPSPIWTNDDGTIRTVTVSPDAGVYVWFAGDGNSYDGFLAYPLDVGPTPYGVWVYIEDGQAVEFDIEDAYNSDDDCDPSSAAGCVYSEEDW
jgi:hypothetical protein